MGSWIIAATEWRRLMRNRLALLGVLSVLFVPLLYSGLYLYAFWDPYGSLEKLPVALVNLDEGGMEQGKSVHFGSRLTRELQEKVKLDWHKTNAAEARKGVEGDRYYLVVTIPRSFSRDILSVGGNDPRKAQLIFTLNEGKNYITSQISKRLEGEVREKIGNRLTREYVQNLLDLAKESKGHINQAASAADRLAREGEKLAEGSQSIEKATKKAAKASRSLEQGATQLAAETSRLSDRIHQLAAGAEKLAEGVRQAREKVRQTDIRQGIKIGQARLHTIGSRLDQTQSDLTAVLNTVREARSALNQAMITNPSLKADPKLQALRQRLDEIKAHLSGFPDRLSRIRRTLPSLTAEIKHLSSKLDSLETGTARLANAGKKLAAGTDRLHKGAVRLRKGTAELAQSLEQLSRKTGTWTTGAKQLARGNRELSNRLSDALHRADTPSEGLAPIISEPIHTREQRLFPVTEYGIGLAPYFLPLSLWVGSLITFFVVPLADNRWRLTPYHPGIRAWGKYLTLLPIGFFQAVVTGWVIREGLGLPLAVPWAYYTFLVLIAWMSIAMVGFLLTLFGKGPGRLLAVILLILQLVSSGGTFPIELTPEILQQIHPFLPMSYGVQGLRDIIALDNLPGIYRSSFILGIFCLVPLILWIALQRRRFQLSDLKDRDELEGL
ncbi:YhgE/Pip domain-containing protein [Paludifilum halophilum]|nr:YhgE/Pip domain-containing protein [Paludifilum halophilum]